MPGAFLQEACGTDHKVPHHRLLEQEPHEAVFAALRSIEILVEIGVDK